MSAVRPHGVVEVAAAGAAGMTTGVRVRLAERSDVEGIFAIYDREVLEGTATGATVCFTEAEREAWFERHPPDRHPLVVAVEGDGAVVAWAGLAPWSPRRRTTGRRRTRCMCGATGTGAVWGGWCWGNCSR